MKKNRLLSILLAMIMLLAMSVPAFASESGSITINDAVEGQTYTVYKILDLESYAKDEAYAYKASSAWDEFINSAEIKGIYVDVDDQGYVTWIEGASAADFARIAREYAKDNSIADQGSVTAESATVKFENLELGYYLMDSSLGILCSLDTADADVVIEEKNDVPVIDKEVQEDSTGEWGKTNDADFMQTVYFKAVVKAKKGAENYVVHDRMSEGLTLNTDSIAIEGLTKDTDYTVVTEDIEDGCTFHISFAQEYLDTITADQDIVITYSAELNQDAVVAGTGNPNDIKLTYGDNNETAWVQTVTYTWDMGILKYGNGDESKVLKGASFVLLNSNKDKVAKIVDGKFVSWDAVPEDENWDGYELTTGEDGKIAIEGLDADTYYLEETIAPAGYNKLADPVEVVVNGSAVAKVNNQSGTELPSTGGMGTTLLYLLGGALIIGAAGTLIMRRRSA